MSWQRGARLGFAAIGIGCVVAIWALRKDPPTGPSPVLTLTPGDRTAIAQGGPSTRTLFEGSRASAVMSFSSWARYADPDRTVSGKVHLEFKDEGLEIWADEAELGGDAVATAPRVVNMAGHVRLRTRDGLEVSSGSATYDSDADVVKMPGAVTFTKGRMAGRGTGGTYDRKLELFVLDADANVRVAAGPDGRGGLETSATRLTAARLEKFTRLDEQATIVTETETLKSDTATVYFTDDEQHLKLVDLQGKASVEPIDTGSAGRRPAMRADHITLTFDVAGNTLSRSTLTGQAVAILSGGQSIEAPWLDIALARDGAVVTGIDARSTVKVVLAAAGDEPARTIDGATLAARGDETRGLTAARFDAAPGQHVVFTERTAKAGRPASRTDARSRVLVLGLDGALDAMKDAEFRDDVRFVSDGTEAMGEWARYVAARETLELRQRPGGFAGAADGRLKPTVTQDGLWVSGETITVGIVTRDLEASGGVATRLRPSASSGHRPTAIFEEGRDVVGAADALSYAGASRKATYTGTAASPAKVSQKDASGDGSEVTGEVVTIDDTAGTLAARRGVTTKFRVADSTGGDRSDPLLVTYVMTAAEFDYADATRQATYGGQPAILRADTRLVEGHQIDLILARESRALEKLTAAGAVYTTFDTSYEATGDRLDFDAASGLYVLMGRPVEMRGPDETGKECVRSTGGTLAHYNRSTKSVAWPRLMPQGRDQRVVSDPWPCGKSIR